jgi:hypothetical protein
MASLSRSGVEPEPIRLGRFDSLTAREGNLDQILVIHLHGAVSWYYDDRNNIITDPFDRPFNPARTPALLLPDDTKHPANFLPGLDSTWAIFQSVLRRATHVLVLGHRLNDRHLVGALKGWRGANQIAVVAYRESVGPDGTYEPPSHEEQEHYAALFGRTTTVIPSRFGQAEDHLDFDQQLMQAGASGS